jgi:hypothetical protein
MRGSIGLLSCAWAAEIFPDRERQARAEHVARAFANAPRGEVVGDAGAAERPELISYLYDQGVAVRQAACSCEQLRLSAEGEPIRVSVCHCPSCQRRTGSAFGVQARFDAEQVTSEGTSRQYVCVSDRGEKSVFHFCPDCGVTVFYTAAQRPESSLFPSVCSPIQPSLHPPDQSGKNDNIRGYGFQATSNTRRSPERSHRALRERAVTRCPFCPIDPSYSGGSVL